MTIPTFTWDDGVNGYLSEPLEIEDMAIVRLELSSRAPVVTLKKEDDGGYANYGQSPKDYPRHEITVRVTEKTTIRLATPVKVLECQIIGGVGV